MPSRVQVPHLRTLHPSLSIRFSGLILYIFWLLGLSFCPVIAAMVNWREAAPLYNPMASSMFDAEPDHQKEGPPSLLPTVVGCRPPPVRSPAAALSLRNRESSALALKHIFDQMQRNQAGGNASAQGFQALRNQSKHDLRQSALTEPGVDLTLHKPPPQHATLSSLPSERQPASRAFIQKLSRASPSTTKQPTAQLTIFYSGTVNVYNDVPADKAQAIMLLAGTGNLCSDTCQSPFSSAEMLTSVTEASASKVAPCVPMTTMCVSQGVISSTPSETGSIPKPSVVAPFTVRPVIASIPSSPSVVVASDTPKSQLPLKRPHAGIELPYARKASLARFLEKRKDRLQLKQANEGTKQEMGGGITEESVGQEKDIDFHIVNHASFREGAESGHGL